MEEVIINGKALYTPKGAAREYAAVGCNYYTGCPHNCEYCYLKRGAPSKQLGGTEVKLKKCFKDWMDAMRICEREMDKHLEYLQKVGIFLSFTSDPLIGETLHLTYSTVFYALKNRDIPVILLTKASKFVLEGSEFWCIPTWLAKEKRQKLAVGFTLTGHDEMEAGADTNASRIEAMKYIKESRWGYSTWSSIEPIIDFDASLEMIRQAVRYCDHFRIGLRSGVKKDYYKCDELCTFIKNVYSVFTDAEREYGVHPTVYWKDSITDRVNRLKLEPGMDRFTVGMDFMPFMRP